MFNKIKEVFPIGGDLTLEIENWEFSRGGADFCYVERYHDGCDVSIAIDKDKARKIVELLTRYINDPHSS